MFLVSILTIEVLNLYLNVLYLLKLRTPSVQNIFKCLGDFEYLLAISCCSKFFSICVVNKKKQRFLSSIYFPKHSTTQRRYLIFGLKNSTLFQMFLCRNNSSNRKLRKL